MTPLLESIMAWISRYVLVDSALGLGLFLSLLASHRFTRGREGQETDLWTLTRRLLETCIENSRFKWLWRILFFFPCVCVYPLYRFACWLAEWSRVSCTSLLHTCLILFALLAGRAGALSDPLRDTWGTCLFWTAVIAQAISAKENDDDHRGKGKSEEPDDPTPHGDAAERWLHTHQHQPTTPSTC